MKNTLSLIITCAVIICFGCTSTKKIEKTITFDYSNITFTPGELKKTLQNKVEVTCIPLDAAMLNKETFEASIRDGNYEQELRDENEKIIFSNNVSPREANKLKNYLQNAFDEIQKLEKESSMPAYAAYQLKLRILKGEKFGKDGTEKNGISSNDFYPDAFNPFKINQKYFSVFKITFENLGNEIEKIKLKDLQIISGEELLYPLEIAFFEKELEEASEKLKNVFRMNMPEELIITPSQRVTKYIAVPAINTKNENLRIQLLKDKDVLNFDFSIKEQKLVESKEYERYDIIPTGLSEPSLYDYYYVICFQNGVQIATIDDYFFIEKGTSSIPLSIYSVAIQRYTLKTYSAKKISLKLSDLKKNSTYMFFESKVVKEKKKK